MEMIHITGIMDSRAAGGPRPTSELFRFSWASTTGGGYCFYPRKRIPNLELGVHAPKAGRQFRRKIWDYGC